MAALADSPLEFPLRAGDAGFASALEAFSKAAKGFAKSPEEAAGSFGVFFFLGITFPFLEDVLILVPRSQAHLGRFHSKGDKSGLRGQVGAGINLSSAMAGFLIPDTRVVAPEEKFYGTGRARVYSRESSGSVQLKFCGVREKMRPATDAPGLSVGVQTKYSQETSMTSRNPVHLVFALAAILGLFCLAVLAPQAVAQTIFSQDLTIHETTTGGGMMGQPPRTTKTTVYMSRSAMKRTSADGNDSIIRFDQGKIITINNKEKTYTEMTTAEIQKMLDETASAVVANKEQMEMMRKMMGQTPDTFTVTKEGACEKIAGFDTVKYHVTGMMDMEICAAPELKIPPLYYDSLKIQMPSNPIFDMRKMFDEYKKIDGLPLKTVVTIRVMNNEMKTTTVVDSVEKTSLDSSIFDPPAGYKKTAFTPGK